MAARALDKELNAPATAAIATQVGLTQVNDLTSIVVKKKKKDVNDKGKIEEKLVEAVGKRKANEDNEESNRGPEKKVKIDNEES